MALFIILLLLAGFFFGIGFFDFVQGGDLLIDQAIIFMLCFIISLLLVLLLDKML